MQAHNMTSFADIEGYWLERVNAILGGVNRTAIIWHDPYDNGARIPANMTIEVWGGGLSMLDAVLKSGYNAIYAAPFYLDHIQNDWQRLYSQRISDTSPSFSEPTRLLGADAPMWGEWVDFTNSFQRVWPRAAAVAEIVWSDTAVPCIPVFAATRLANWRCRMLMRELLVQPVGPFPNTTFYCNPL